jgi:hypothetical protein
MILDATDRLMRMSKIAELIPINRLLERFLIKFVGSRLTDGQPVVRFWAGYWYTPQNGRLSANG